MVLIDWHCPCAVELACNHMCDMELDAGTLGSGSTPHVAQQAWAIVRVVQRLTPAQRMRQRASSTCSAALRSSMTTAGESMLR